MLSSSRASLLRLASVSRASRGLCMRYQHTIPQIDSTCIPLKPTWSVNKLLSSYPRPTITPSTLKRLHELSALIPPAEGTPQHDKLTREMEELVKLVEAVKLVDVSDVAEDGAVPDGRIWVAGEGINLDAPTQDVDEVDGRALLAHASRTIDGMYVVESDKPRG
ncbi:uncharacterized protein BXZ73DRAFT_90806 [Epithele typhae]|uniref:uncharacterized protein n=1 Tax=Epithele typhae TaxID=378194 RepID=UPI002007F86F|nr:uncharacterized protein BXZ73DRAFT_90806 [Epithele typhae]KAH9927114.1 hypothetical protein BXZ73DRAFT_90806 [Epithele typhae]